MMQEPERRVDHVTGARGDLGAATKTGKIVADVAVVLLDREGQILAGEELLRRDQPVKALSSVRKIRPSMPTLSRSRRQVASSRPPSSQARVRRATGSKARQSQTLFFSKSAKLAGGGAVRAG